jgi:hypothetical protein
MTLKETIEEMVKNYPSLFQDRVQCLDHLFCVNGNGYKWINGQLTYPEEIRELEEITHSTREIPPIDRYEMIEMCLQRQPYEHIRTRSYRDREYRLDAHTQELLVNFFRMERALKNIDKIATPGFHEWASQNYRFYPVCEYAKMLNLPENIQPDWLDGAKETLNLVKRYGFDPEHKIDTKKLKLIYRNDSIDD